MKRLTKQGPKITAEDEALIRDMFSAHSYPTIAKALSVRHRQNVSVKTVSGRGWRMGLRRHKRVGLRDTIRLEPVKTPDGGKIQGLSERWAR